MTKSPDPARNVMNSLRRIVQALRSSASHSEAQTGLSAAQTLVLKQIHANGSVSVNELAGLTFTHQSTVSEIVSRLEARGILTRDRSTKDRRRVEVRLTGNGMALVEQSAPSAHDRLMAAVKSLPSEDLDNLCTGLEALVTAAGLRSQKPEMFFENAREHERTTT